MMLMPFSAAAGFAYETTIITVLYHLFHVGSNFIRSQGLIASQRMKQKRIRVRTNQYVQYGTSTTSTTSPTTTTTSTSKSLDPQNPQLLNSLLLNSSFFILQTLLSFRSTIQEPIRRGHDPLTLVLLQPGACPHSTIHNYD